MKTSDTSSSDKNYADKNSPDKNYIDKNTINKNTVNKNCIDKNSVNKNSSYKNPSRKSCEQMIQKILSRELEIYGANRHFKHASDFLVYFESLYPPSPGLTRQIQRAVSSMNLARDKDGYYMIHKTVEEYKAEQELSHMLRFSSLSSLNECTPLLLQTESWQQASVIHLLKSIPKIYALIETLAGADNGVIIYTKEPEPLTTLIKEFMELSSE